MILQSKPYMHLQIEQRTLEKHFCMESPKITCQNRAEPEAKKVHAAYNILCLILKLIYRGILS